MNIFDWFTAGPKAAQEVLDAGIKSVDALILTDEEKLKYRQALVDQWIKLQETLGPESSIRAVTRRLLSFVILLPYVALVLAAAILYGISASYAQFLLDLADGQFGYMALSVAAFYFGPYMFGQAFGKKKKGKEE